VAQGESPEFKPPYLEKRKHRSNLWVCALQKDKVIKEKNKLDHENLRIMYIKGNYQVKKENSQNEKKW
jgi:hypothetical protein